MKCHETESPWQFRKIHGTWHKRPAYTAGDWSRLHVEQVGLPAEPTCRSRTGTGKIAPPSINRWSWVSTINTGEEA